MSALAAIAIFPILTLLLVALTKAENMLGSLVEEPPVPTTVPATPVPLQIVNHVAADVLNDAPTGEALPVPRPNLRLVEAEERAAA